MDWKQISKHSKKPWQDRFERGCFAVRCVQGPLVWVPITAHCKIGHMFFSASRRVNLVHSSHPCAAPVLQHNVCNATYDKCERGMLEIKQRMERVAKDYAM